MAACGVEEGCTLAGVEGAAPGLPLSAWLVLRPTRLASCPRPSVPEGCVHPGADYAYSRLSGALSLEVVCTLPERFRRAEPDCEAAKAWLGGAPVPMPSEEDEILPLARLTCIGEVLQPVDMSARPRLLPMHVLETLIACCKCEDEVEEPEVPDRPTPPDFGWDKPFESPLGDLVEKIRDGLPGGSADLGKTFEEVFKDGTMLEMLRGGRAKDRGISRAFAASLLVSDEDSLDRFLKMAPQEFYKWTLENGVKTSVRGVLNPGASDVVRKAIAAATLGDAMEQSEGYGWVRENLGDLPGKELAEREPEKIRDVFNVETPAAVAALQFLHARLVSLKK